MKKTITICGKEYNMKSSAYTQFKYKNETGRKLLEDIQQLTKLQDASQDDLMSNVDDLFDIVLRITYIMIDEADSSQVTSYEDFLKGLDGLLDNQSWLEEVITLATAPISRGVQGNPQESSK